MSPSNNLRAMLLRPSMTGLTTKSSTATLLPQSARTSLMISGFRRAASTSPENQQQPQQKSPTPLSSIPTPTPTTAVEAKATPPSLRSYPYTLKVGTVSSVGKMDRTVRVAHRHTFWDKHLRKSYPQVTNFLVSDPRNSLREGDVIEFSSGFPKSRNVHHVVERIVAPFGSGIEERPPVMSREEREAVREQKRAAKWERREKRFESGDEDSGVKEHVGRIRSLILEREAYM
ncbi:uS17 family ribosomal protein [Aspergillus ruber CBS 135680]|uniref:Nucleic acid-binding protein n=1 Tax=Aspergillus ruber (strain CBS 135680) TaxID=1388766 RepID=A0A017S351_ASPRC|nr:nucleic acid-binding protein [Aspergillus ruber CBS 135680]EYE91029.1 nucleic acid-binding protein [Aspergillus ruber CBS 135680]